MKGVLPLTLSPTLTAEAVRLPQNGDSSFTTVDIWVTRVPAHPLGPMCHAMSTMLVLACVSLPRAFCLLLCLCLLFLSTAFSIPVHRTVINQLQPNRRHGEAVNERATWATTSRAEDAQEGRLERARGRTTHAGGRGESQGRHQQVAAGGRRWSERPPSRRRQKAERRDPLIRGFASPSRLIAC